jgi:hypothetical protein
MIDDQNNSRHLLVVCVATRDGACPRVARGGGVTRIFSRMAWMASYFVKLRGNNRLGQGKKDVGCLPFLCMGDCRFSVPCNLDL